MPRQRKSPWVVDFLRDLHQGEALPDLLQAVLRHALSLVPAAQSGSVLLLDEPAGVFRFAAAEGWDMDALSRIAIPKDRMIQRGLPHDRPAIIRDPLSRNAAFLGEELAAAIAAAGPVAAILSAPVTDGTRLVGVVNLDSRDDPDAFSNADLRRLGAAWEEVALAVVAARGRADLREREELFRLLFERLADAALIMSPDGTILEANPAAERQTGYSRDELRGMNVVADLLVSPPATAECLRKEGGATFEVEKRRKDGTTAWAECAVVGVEYRGAPALFSVGREITNRKRLEQEQAARLTALEALARAAPGIGGSRDPREVVERIVAAAREIAGADHANILLFAFQGDLVETFDPHGAPRIPVRIREKGFSHWILDTGQSVVIDDIGPEGETSPGVVAADGKLTPASPVLVQEGVRSLVGLPVSVRGERRAVLYLHSRRPAALARHVPVLALLASQAGVALENAFLYQDLRESEARHRALFDHSPVSLWIEDFSSVARDLEALRADGVTDLAAFLEANPHRIRDLLAQLRVREVNRATLDLYGARDKDEITARLPEIIPDEVFPLLAAELQAIWEGRAEFAGEGTNRTVDGRPLHIRLVWRVLPGHERTYDRVLVSVLDITQRVEAESAALRRDAVLAAAAFAAERFLRGGEFDQEIAAVLARLGAAADASRVYVFQDHRDEQGRLLTSQRCEWAAPDASSQAGNLELQGVSYHDAGFERWVQEFARGEAVVGCVGEFPEAERAFLAAQGILSIVVVPIMVGAERWGFVGFDECRRERRWSRAEVEALRAAAGMLGAAIERGHLERQLRARSDELQGLYTVSVSLGTSLELEEVFQQVFEEVGQLVRCDAFTLALADMSHGEFRIAFAVEEGERHPEVVVPLDPQGSLTAWVASSREPLIIRDLEAERDRLPAVQQAGKAVRSWLGVPLLFQDEVLGVLSVQSFAPHAYNENDLRLLLTVSASVATAIRNGRTYTRLASIERKLRAVEDVSRRMRLAQDKADLYRVVLELTDSVLGYRPCAILEPHEGELVVVAGHEEISWAHGLRVGLDGKGITAAAARSREPVYVADVSADRRYVRGSPDTRCELAFPINVGERLLGVLDVQTDQVDGIPPQDRDLLGIVASELAVTMAGLEQLARLEGLSAKLARLHEASRLLTRCTNDEDVCRAAVRAMVEVLGFEQASIGLGRGDLLVPVAWAGDISSKARTFRKGEGIAGKTWLTGEPAWGNSDRFAEARPVDPRIQAFISVPIGSAGVIQAVSPRRDAFTSEDVTLAEILARRVFEELRRAQLEQELREQAIRDSLTGLYNRRFLVDVLTREIERAKRYGHPLALVMADVDEFKSVNDRCGHLVGDAALRRVAEVLQESVRAGDYVFRYGGEEFVLVLPETGDGGGDAVQRLRENVAAIPLDVEPGLTVSVSLGYVVWSPTLDGPTTLEEILRQADEVLYAMKRHRAGSG